MAIVSIRRTGDGQHMKKGFTLTEERQYDPHTGTLLSFVLEDYRIPGIVDIPEIELRLRGFAR